MMPFMCPEARSDKIARFATGVVVVVCVVCVVVVVLTLLLMTQWMHLVRVAEHLGVRLQLPRHLAPSTTENC